MAAVQDRHVAHYRLVAAQARAAYEGTANAAGHARLESEWDNLRAALGWAIARQDAVVRSFWNHPDYRRVASIRRPGSDCQVVLIDAAAGSSPVLLLPLPDLALGFTASVHLVFENAAGTVQPR